jgi:glucosylceramidase
MPMPLHLLKRATFAGWVCLVVAGCAAGGDAPRETPPPAVATGPLAALWLTTADKSKLLARSEAGRFGNAAPLALNIEVDASQRFQTMAGFGASITDASAWLMQNRLSTAQRDALLQELFGRGDNGLGFDLTRLTLASSDFSLQHYSYNDMPAGQTDVPLARFSIDPMRAEVLPVLKRAQAVNPGLLVMASPWSPPGWMKTTDSLIKGSLKPEYYDAFARYLVKYVDAMAAEGVDIFALTLQNEPHFEPGDYPGMRLEPAARAAVIGKHLGPLLEARQLKTQIIEWDHNWDEPSAPLAVLNDPLAKRYIAGVGWHCYAG